MQSAHALIERSLARLGLATLLALLGLAAAHQATAHAQAVADPDFWKQTTEHRNTVNRLVYSQSPQAIPAGYDAVREAEEILRQQQRALPPSNPQAPSLWQQTRRLTVRSALSRPASALGVIGLGAGSFALGLQIGEGINAKYLRFNLPPKPSGPGGHIWAPEHDYALEWAEKGSTSASAWSSFYDQAAMPYDGWILANSSMGSYYRTWQPTSHEQCGGELPALFTGFDVTTFQWNACWLGSAGLAPEYTTVLTTPETEVITGPIEDYTDQPVDRATTSPTPPAQTTVEQAVETELDKPENELLRRWLNYKLGSPNETDPTGIGPPNASIEFPDRYFKWQKHSDDFPEYEDAEEYWAGAADIVERKTGGDLDVRECHRAADGTTFYWDSLTNVLVIVRDGVIVTSYKPTEGYEHFRAKCDEEPT